MTEEARPNMAEYPPKIRGFIVAIDMNAVKVRPQFQEHISKLPCDNPELIDTAIVAMVGSKLVHVKVQDGKVAAIEFVGEAV